MFRQTHDAARVGQAGLHTQSDEGDPGVDDRRGDGEIVDERDDGRFKPTRVGAQQQVAEHRLGPAVLEAVDDVNDAELAHTSIAPRGADSNA